MCRTTTGDRVAVHARAGPLQGVPVRRPDQQRRARVPARLHEALPAAGPSGAQPRALAGIVTSHLGPDLATARQDLLEEFLTRRGDGDLAADQLLNAVYLTSYAAREPGADRTRLAQMLLRHLDRLA